MSESEPLDRVTVRADAFDGESVMRDMRNRGGVSPAGSRGYPGYRAAGTLGHRRPAHRPHGGNVTRTESRSTPAVIGRYVRTGRVDL